MKLGDVGSERAILAGIYQYGEEALIDISDIISSESFTVESNQLLYTCLIKALEENKSIDLTAVITTAERLNLQDRIINSKQDREFIRSLLNFPIKLENVRGYARRLGKLEFARKAQSRHKQAHDELENMTGNEPVNQILAISENAIFDLIQEVNRGKEGHPTLLSEGSEELLVYLAENPAEMSGLPTPWSTYNTMIGGGLRRGGVNLFASRPGIGKSTLAKEIALHFTMELGIPILMLDSEMEKNDHLFRSLASLSNVEIDKIETGKFGQNSKEKLAVLDANKKLKDIRFYHETIAGKPFEEVLSIIRRWIVKEVGYDENGNTNDCLILYDYFKLMTPDSLEDMAEHQAIGFQISRLSDFCKEYSFPCVAFVQLNRDGITKETSDILAQSDRLLWLCHSVAIFKPSTLEEQMSGRINRKIIILKARFGDGANIMDSGKDCINMYFNGSKAQIKELGLKSKAQERQAVEDNGFIQSRDNISTDSGENRGDSK